MKTSTWTCIDGIDQATWKYVPLGIAADLKNLAATVSASLPGSSIEDTAWTAAISSSRRTVVKYEEQEFEISKAA